MAEWWTSIDKHALTAYIVAGVIFVGVTIALVVAAIRNFRQAFLLLGTKRSVECGGERPVALRGLVHSLRPLSIPVTDEPAIWHWEKSQRWVRTTNEKGRDVERWSEATVGQKLADFAIEVDGQLIRVQDDLAEVYGGRRKWQSEGGAICCQ
ncbi:hypothetical protein ACFL27_22540 [candidate division CSSED10-310 bacterium]|uniref:Uncharacterized protein n=1 Tax=candidate division CSSED10-310 bacterium TaxID=2855610 RepID=A0ABV6Z3G0_UNCC1